MTVVLERPTTVVVEPRNLIPSALFGRLVARVASDEGVSAEYAERVVEQTLAFLTACARTPDTILAPSKAIDAGWHTFILYTRDYADFCRRTAGRFIHHTPDDAEEGEPLDETAAVEAAIASMRLLGLPVDDELWLGVSGDCSQCHAGCTDSPKGE